MNLIEAVRYLPLQKNKQKKKTAKLQAVNCTKADPPRMLILQGAQGRSEGQDQPGMELQAIVMEAQQDVTGTTRTIGVGEPAWLWAVQRHLARAKM